MPPLRACTLRPVKVLIVDDDQAIRGLLRTLLVRWGHNVTEADDGAHVVELLASESFDLVITDLVMPQVGGIEVIGYVRERQPKTPVVMLTAGGSIRDCVAAMRAGAFNFLTKPFQPSDLEEIVRQAGLARGGRAGLASTQSGDEGQPQIALIGESQELQAVIDTIERVASTDSTVLITGESGTGKEVVARLLHGSSPRLRGPLVALNCGAIPDTLIESELFGHAKGAFTGATDARPGKFLQANGGTLFLDEIGELPLPMQVKLLRALQERQVTPVGDSRARAFDVRIIAATNRDLEIMMQEGTFRADLYYRLDVLPIRLPALRERRDDIPLLARHFLESMNRRFDKDVVLGEEALAVLRSYNWPGNVREMENLFERVVILSRGGTIQVADLPPRLQGSPLGPAQLAAAAIELGEGGIDLQAAVVSFENSLIERALKQAGGNRTRAAELLGLSRTTLFDKLKRQS
jgi:two-component system, NtrC family, response regulator AtoC